MMVVLALLSGVAFGCDSRSETVGVHWSVLPTSALPGGRSVPAYATTVVAGGAGRPWLIGGVIPVGAGPGAAFRPFTYPTVAIWVAGSPTGPWRLASMEADPQRDGPNETIRYLAVGRKPAVAFGWRNSPTEGYPRPSVWDAGSPADSSWTEIVEDREFFGGPNVVGFGGASAGPHGYFVAGTWTGPSGAPTASVWSSTDGSRWSRDSTDPTFAGRSGELPLVTGVADGPSGVMLAATMDTPTRADPTGQRGALWYSPDGRTWSRFEAAAVDDRIPNSSFGAVTATEAGWVVAGTTTEGGRVRPIVWFVPAGGGAPALTVLEPNHTAAGTAVTSVAVNADRIVVAGVSGGRPVMWTATVHRGVPTGFKRLTTPPSAPPSVQTVSLSIGPAGMIAALIGKTTSQVWTSSLV